MSFTTQVLESLGDPVIAVDRGGEVVVWTRAAERLLGYPAADVLGGGLPDLGIRLDTLLAGRERRLTLRRRDGGACPATVTATHLLGPEGELQGVVLLVKDLRPWIGPDGEETAGGDVQIVEERLGAAFRGMVETTSGDLERGGRLESLAQSLAEQGRRLLPGISCLIAIVPAGRQEVVHCLAAAGPFAETLLNRSFPRETSVVGSALARNQVVERSDMQLAASSPELFVAAGVNTMRVVPMSAPKPLPDGRRALGAIIYFRAEARPFTPAERRLLDDFGALVSMSVTRAELQATAERLTVQLQLAVDVARDLARSLDVAEVIRRLARRAAVATGADRCALVRVEDGADGELVTVAIYDVSGHEGGVGFRQPIHARRTLLEAVVTRAPVLAGPAEELAGFSPELRRGLQDIRHAAMIPLVYGGQVIAILVVSRRRGRAFTQEEVATAMLLGGPAALALRNSYLYAQTEEASRVKTDFLDMAAHELRTPLTVISGYLSILREGAFGPAPPAWQDPLRILDAKATELRQLVDDLLLAARLETGRLESARHPVDLREIAEQAVEAADQVPELMLPEDPVMVRGDRDQLARLVDHLVANALAYGRDAMPPWARVKLEPRADEGVARLTVDDRGRGLPPGAGDRIFERFARLEDPDQPMVPGTGLGLYIARELARRHGGWVELEWAQPGVGSRFVLTLPLLEGATHLDREDE